jgi:hypothetical protein
MFCNLDIERLDTYNANAHKYASGIGSSSVIQVIGLNQEKYWKYKPLLAID